MGRAHGYADGDFADCKLTNAMDGRDRGAGMLAGDAFEYTPHFFFGEALVSFVLKSRDGLAFGVVPYDSVKDAYAASARMFHRASDTVERDLLVGQRADRDRRTARNRRQDVDPVSIAKRLVLLDEITVHGQPHAPKKLRKRWKALGDGVS